MVTTGAGIYIAVPAAVGAAASFGLTAALQHRATQSAPTRGALQPRLLFDLIHQPLWAGAIVANVVGLGLQVVALDFGPLMTVQPVLVTGILFTVVFGSALSGKRPDRVLLGGAVCVVAGLAAFLAIARPSGDDDQLTLRGVLPLAAGLAGILLLCLAVASRTRRESRALSLALACGVLYGVTAGLIKVIMGQLQYGLFAPFQHWTLYAVCLIGPIGFLLNQNAYQAERVAAPALAVIITTDPLIGIGIGRMWLDESIRTGALPVLGEVLALGVMAAGIYALAHRSPHLAEDTGTPGRRGGTGGTSSGAGRPDRERQTNLPYGQEPGSTPARP